ncbi:Fur family transcriptional regulator [Virgifigura deserti]|uniref:Fur family transcriptional regulator n=1 Tax=Virgifigura deserti TaxID=2268457 RepID=UPI003CCBF364
MAKMATQTEGQTRSAFPHRHHNHQRCVDQALGKALSLCEERGARLTSLRRRVLELVWRSHEPVGAYDILEQLQRDGHRAAPPTVYRALEFLRDQGLVHRIESLNAFVGCPYPDESHVSQFLICTACSEVAEIDGTKIRAAASRNAAAAGFAIDRLTIELRGLCARCNAHDQGSSEPHDHAR